MTGLMDTLFTFLQAAKKGELHVVTDFVPSTVPAGNTWLRNSSMSEFFLPNSRNLDFSNENLLNELIVSTCFKLSQFIDIIFAGNGLWP